VKDEHTSKVQSFWSYNSGILIGGLKELFIITKKEKYLKIG
jgi:rhamnogalacturonyl hydrolase YesR